MRDPRIDRLARVIVRYSLELREGQTFLITSGAVAEPLVQALYEETLEVGAHPMLDLMLEGTQEAFFRLAGDEQLDWVSPTQRWAFEHADARIRVLSDTNTRELSGVSPEKQTRRQRAMHPYMTKMMERSAAGELRWNVTLFPTNAYASDASMSLRDYEDFIFRACLCDDVVIADELMQLDTEMGQARPRYTHENHLHVGDDRSTRQDGSHAGLHCLGVKPGQTVELEIGRGVDHAPHQRPLLGGVGVRPRLAIDDGEGIVLDLLTGLGQLFGDGVGHSACAARPWSGTG